uniref:ADP,ATP carrier protein n=1 Tax=Oryza brachyantha TaxID=4533 RepID=J3LPM9_ORYBR
MSINFTEILCTGSPFDGIPATAGLQVLGHADADAEEDRAPKDVLIFTTQGSITEIIPFLKTWTHLPRAIGFMLLYTKLADVLSKEALFYPVILPFIAFFSVVSYLLYPMRDTIHPSALADRLFAGDGDDYSGSNDYGAPAAAAGSN